MLRLQIFWEASMPTQAVALVLKVEQRRDRMHKVNLNLNFLHLPGGSIAASYESLGVLLR